MFDQVASGDRPYICEIWTTEQCLVAPARMAKKRGFREAAKDLTARGWPVFLRNTGGDVTPQGFGMLNISIAFALPKGSPPSIEDGFDTLCAPIFAELSALGHRGRYAAVAGAFCDGAYNVVVDGRKVAGTAQRWRRSHADPARHVIFAHALVLIDADLVRGIEAVNRLRKACGERDEVHVDAHVNMRALHTVGHWAGSPDTLAERLKESFERSLETLTGATRTSYPSSFSSQDNAMGENYV